MKSICCFLFFIIIPVIGFSQEEDLGIPKRPDYTPPGYEWVLQQEDDGNLRWVAKKEEREEIHHEPEKPTADPPIGYDWFPIYEGNSLISWKAEPIPSWFDSNRAMIEYIGAFILSIMNIFSFVLGKKSGSSTIGDR